MNAKLAKLLKGVRIYDNSRASVDRYTVCYPAYRLKPIARIIGDDAPDKSNSVWEASGWVCTYLVMSSAPFHPQGVCQHGEHWKAIDRPSHKHLGKRITFDQLPEDCQTSVLQDLQGILPRRISINTELGLD